MLQYWWINYVTSEIIVGLKTICSLLDVNILMGFDGFRVISNNRVKQWAASIMFYQRMQVDFYIPSKNNKDILYNIPSYWESKCI